MSCLGVESIAPVLFLLQIVLEILLALSLELLLLLCIFYTEFVYFHLLQVLNVCMLKQLLCCIVLRVKPIQLFLFKRLALSLGVYLAFSSTGDACVELSLVIIKELVNVSADSVCFFILKSEFIHDLFSCLFFVLITTYTPILISFGLVLDLTLTFIFNALNTIVVLRSLGTDVLIDCLQVKHCNLCFLVHL